MTATDSWTELILDASSPRAAWEAIFRTLADLATVSSSPVELHNHTVAADRLLAESAWELWQVYSQEAPRTVPALQRWWATPSSYGHAVLVVDALSLREVAALLGGAKAQGIEPVSVQVTGAEVPSDTDHFAKALGLGTRSGLANNGASSSFAFAADSVYTDVLNLPFEDCLGSIPPEANVFFWHTWLDDLIHVHKRLPDQIYKLAHETLQSEGFWRFVDRLRQGRRLVITADHGYAVARQFSTEERDSEVITALRDTFGASRYKAATGPWPHRFMPPLVTTENGHHVVMGQRKWAVQGGFPHLCHGGLSLLEVAVPFVELPPL